MKEKKERNFAMYNTFIFVSFFCFVLGLIFGCSKKDLEFCYIAIAAGALAQLLCTLKDFKKSLYKYEDEIEELKKGNEQLRVELAETRIRLRRLEKDG